MESNDALVDRLVEQSRITTDRVADAFRAVDRADFVPDTYSDRAYADRPLPIGDDATISAPHMVAVNTELLAVADDSRVLEIGAGSGYQLALLAELTSDAVVGVEIVAELAEAARDRLSSYDNVTVRHGTGLDAVTGTFDRILYSCAIDAVDRALPFLADDGIIVAPVTQRRGQVLTRYDAATERNTEHGHVRFVDYIDTP